MIRKVILFRESERWGKGNYFHIMDLLKCPGDWQKIPIHTAIGWHHMKMRCKPGNGQKPGAIISGKGKPLYKAWVPILYYYPVKTGTRIEPGKSIYSAVAPAAAQKGIIDAAIWIGYAWADEPRNHAVVMVTGDDKGKVMQTAEALAQNFWKERFKFVFVARVATLKECLDSALKSNKHPFFISDMGDNPTAGGAGDVTWTLKEILARPEFKSAEGPSLIYASIPGPELVKNAIKAGVGAHVEGYAGAQVDARYAPLSDSGNRRIHRIWRSRC